VQDIVQELATQLQRLEQQASVAIKYKNMLESSSVKQQQLYLLKQREALQEQQRVAVEADRAEVELQARLADLRHVEAELASIRQAHYAAGEQVNQSQGALYEVSAEVGRLQAEIRFVVDARQRAQQRLDTLAAQTQQWQDRLMQAQQELAQIGELESASAEHSETLHARAQDHAQVLPDLQDGLRAAQQAAQTQQAQAAQVQQQLGVLAAEQRGVQAQARTLQARRERLLQDERGLQPPDATALLHIQERLAQAQQGVEAHQARLSELQEESSRADEERAAQQRQSHQVASKLAELTARLEALRAMQARLQSQDKRVPWLKKHGLDQLPSLWSRLHVEPGWEFALEAVLRERLAALELGGLESLHAFASDPPPTKLVFMAPAHAAAAALLPQREGFTRLLDKVRVHDAGLQASLAHWLHAVWVADSLQAALHARPELAAGHWLVTPQGHIVGADFVGFFAADSEQSGLLARAQEIDNLDKQVKAQSLMADAARSALLRAESAYAQVGQQLAQARRDAADGQQHAHRLQVEALKLAQLADQARQRSTQIATYLAEVDAQLEDLQARDEGFQSQFEALDAKLAQAQEGQAACEDRMVLAERQLAQAREQQRTLERQAQEASFGLRSLATRRGEWSRSADTAQAQLASLQTEMGNVQQDLTQLDDAAAQAGLQQALACKLDCEHTLAARRNQYDDLTAKLRALDERRLTLERALEPLRACITDWQLKAQAARLGAEQYAKQLDEAHADRQALAEQIARQGVQLAGLQPEIDRLQRDIAALGAVNLAAVDELASAQERKRFLDAQNDDLVRAMTTLEDAIRTIDQETRSLLSGTFDAVNSHFGRMFPELFGGGNARLVITGGEILDSGVQVIAQPPGKKNQSIALLSGGEKALTAIALVFAIFQLNPAPFCLLDEVDAPLDDANTERYAKLVTRMSQDTQFLFISHNKIAMEMAQQLVGVTMQEQGVSRIVAVDMQSALGMAAAEAHA
jgi:chromosome segregation protein